MTALETIKQGILLNDIKTIAIGYKMLTGEELELPRLVLQNTENGGITTTGANKKSIASRVKPKNINLFVDVEGEERKKISKADVKKKVNKVKRPPAVVEVNCIECRVRARVRKDLLQQDGTYICSDCIIKKARR
jgi:hypothetical protein